MDVFSVKGVLEELDDVVSDGVFRGEALGPGQDLSRGQRSLLDREAESRMLDINPSSLPGKERQGERAHEKVKPRWISSPAVAVPISVKNASTDSAM